MAFELQRPLRKRQTLHIGGGWPDGTARADVAVNLQTLTLTLVADVPGVQDKWALEVLQRWTRQVRIQPTYMGFSHQDKGAKLTIGQRTLHHTTMENTAEEINVGSRVTQAATFIKEHMCQSRRARDPEHARTQLDAEWVKGILM